IARRIIRRNALIMASGIPSVNYQRADEIVITGDFIRAISPSHHELFKVHLVRFSTYFDNAFYAISIRASRSDFP
ncbi:hypothetical protein, partial [Cronobacter dublinensis]|uniref:hypothetical protein n=1 Tax=Cronobacter dublinensis TaxID=413497 RepID=UPI001F2F036C